MHILCISFFLVSNYWQWISVPYHLQKEVLSSLKFPKSIGRVNDADWAASDKVALSVADGYVAITDVSLTQFMSRLDECAECEYK